MPAPEHSAFQPPPRCAVVDLGSNSVRLVVYEGPGRNPVTLFNEKAVLRLGRGLQTTGLLNPEGVAQALQVMRRYGAIARAMRAHPFEVLATAAVRDASNGPAFVADLQALLPGVPIRVLPGDQEAALSAAGVLCGIPGADGVLADIGGGSLELVRLHGGGTTHGCSLRLGVIRLADRAAADLARARAIVQDDLAGIAWLPEGTGRDLYLVGGAWRALAHIHMAQSGYPLAIVHHYAITRESARELAGALAGSSRRILERLPGAPRRRIEDLPYAGIVLRRLLRAIMPRRVVFCATGIREGWLMRHAPDAAPAEDPVLDACRDLAAPLARDPALPAALLAWTAPLFPNQGAEAARLRHAACLISDAGAYDHPEYRAEQAFLRVLHHPGIAFDHPTRAFLALVLATRYEAAPNAAFRQPALGLLDTAAIHQAELLGLALRLAYTLCAGATGLLLGTALRPEPGRLVLRLPADGGSTGGVFAGEGVQRRLDRLAQALGVSAAIQAG